MTFRSNRQAVDGDADRYSKALDLYGRVLSVVLILLGLRQWAVILGIVAGPAGAFETMPIAWQLVTMYLAVIDLVAAVGLWMRVSWGDVLWMLAAVSEVAFHTIFIRTFGSDYTIVGFHFLALAGYATLLLLIRKDKQKWPFHRR